MFPTDREAFSPPRKKSKIIFDIIKKKLTLKYPCGTIIRLSRKGDSEDIENRIGRKGAGKALKKANNCFLSELKCTKKLHEVNLKRKS